MKIVYAWELGGNRGHLGAALPVLRQLRIDGHDVSICSGAASDAEIATTEFANVWHRAPKRFVTPIGATLPGHADILRLAGGFHDEGNLLVLLRNWRALLSELKADVLISDFAPAALLAAKTLTIPGVVFNTGFFYPPVDAPFPLLDTHGADARVRLRETECIVLGLVNACLATLETPTLSNFASLFRADDVMLVNHPQLDCFERADTDAFVGPVLESVARATVLGRRAPDPRRIRLFAYLNPYFQSLPEVLDMLAGSPSMQSVVYLAGSDAWPDVGRWNAPNLTITTDPKELERRIADIDVVVCRAGVGMINQALAHGVPLALLPMFREQELNAMRVRKLGLGDFVSHAGAQTLRSVIERIAADRMMHTRIAEFAGTFRPANIVSLARRIETCGSQRKERIDPADKPRTKCPLDFGELAVVFLSFDEPNADENFSRLLEAAPDAKRVHGVKGFERAHREAALVARTERFITVDADTVVDRAFFATRASAPPAVSHSTWCWSSINLINGLSYGNGGVKVWNRQHLGMLLSHESPDAAYGMSYDFCFHAGYSQFSRCFATTSPNRSPFQAFRAGFREAVKLGRDGHGQVVPVNVLQKGMSHVNFRRLIVWMSLGSDVTHGLWAVLGARAGFLANFDSDFEPAKISDFVWFESVWADTRGRVIDAANDHTDLAALEQHVASLGNKIREGYGLALLREWSPDRSRQFKENMAARRANHTLFDSFERDI